MEPDGGCGEERVDGDERGREANGRWSFREALRMPAEGLVESVLPNDCEAFDAATEDVLRREEREARVVVLAVIPGNRPANNVVTKACGTRTYCAAAQAPGRSSSSRLAG